MSATIPPSIAAEAILIMAGRALLFATPPLAVAALWWLAGRVDLIIARLFPHLEWERSLGWLNIRAERRARTALRCLGFLIHVALAAALVGIVWTTRELTDVLTAQPQAILSSYVALRVVEVGLCLGVWILFIGSWLIPKIRAGREDAELRQFRAEMEAWEREREPRPRQHPQLVSHYKKPRSDSSFGPMLGQPNRLRRQPGE